MENLSSPSLKRKPNRPPLSDISKRRKLQIASWPAFPLAGAGETNETGRLPAIFEHSGPTVVVQASLQETPPLWANAESCDGDDKSAKSKGNHTDMKELQGKIGALEDHVAALSHTLHQASIYRDELHRCIQSLKGPVKIICRVQPAFTGEMLLFRYPEKELEPGSGLHTVELEYGRARLSLTCDRVFHPDSRQEDIFEELKEEILTVNQGNSVTLLAYGATGSGKTYTLEGINIASGVTAASGLLPRAAMALFECLNPSSQVHIACMSLSNETLADLLNPLSPRLSLKQQNGQVIVDQLSWKQAFSPIHLLSYCQTAISRRKHISHSHYITQIAVIGSGFDGKMTEGRLTLVELAGSEAQTETLSETKSLLMEFYCLRKVLRMRMRAGNGVIPYRESKLTRLLQPCIAAGKVVLIITISEEAGACKETRQTIQYAIEMQTPLA